MHPHPHLLPLHRLFVVILALVLLAAGLTAPANATTLAKNGKPRATIKLEHNAIGPTRTAVRELVRYIKQMSGAELDVVESGVPVDTPVKIWIGREQDRGTLRKHFPDVDLALDEYEEIRIAVRDAHVLIIGRDGKISGPPQQRGTSQAIYTFLRRYLGVRWFWPGALGTDVPDRPTITLDEFTYGYAPPLMQRYLRVQHYWKGAADYRGDHRQPRIVAGRMHKLSDAWRRHQRVDLKFIRAGHAFTDWWDKYHESHPEYFALQPEGVRSSFPKPSHVKMCISDPGFTEQWTADAVRRLRRDNSKLVVSASPNDSSYEGYCTCEACRAWDAADAPTITLEYEGQEVEHVALTDRYARWWNKLAERIEARFPARDAYVGTWAYGAYRTPPTEVQLADNIIVGYIGGLPAYNRERRQREYENWRGWARQVQNMVWRPNLFYYDRGMPLIFAERAAKDMAWLTEHNMVGIDVDSVYGHWALQGVQYYLLARLAWNPDLDVDAVLDDYMRRAFGASAAPHMRRYFDTLEDAFYEKVELAADASGGLERIAQLPRIYTPALLRELQSRLDQARAALGRGAEAELHRKRIAFYQVGLDFTKLQTDAIAAMTALRDGADGPNKPALLKRATEASRERDAFLDAQMERFTLNTLIGFHNWGRNGVLRDYFGPPDDTFTDSDSSNDE